jgi:hypothetical protein
MKGKKLNNLFYSEFLLHCFEESRRRITEKVSILLILFIFGISIQVWADSVKSINHASNPINTIKMDENNGYVQRKMESGKEPLNITKKQGTGIQLVPPYSNDGAITISSEPNVNFLITLEQRKKLRWIDSLNLMISTFEFSQADREEKFLNYRKVSGIKSYDQEFGISSMNPSPNGNIHFEEEGKLTTLKHLQSKRDEIFNEIFMGFRFSLKPMSRFIFLEINITPSPEKGPGVMIPF